MSLPGPCLSAGGQHQQWPSQQTGSPAADGLLARCAGHLPGDPLLLLSPPAAVGILSCCLQRLQVAPVAAHIALLSHLHHWQIHCNSPMLIPPRVRPRGFSEGSQAAMQPCAGISADLDHRHCNLFTPVILPCQATHGKTPSSIDPPDAQNDRRGLGRTVDLMDEADNLLEKGLLWDRTENPANL